jgi:hypothetical protein
MKTGSIQEKKREVQVDKSLEKYKGKDLSPKKTKAFTDTLEQIKAAIGKFAKTPVH